MAGEGLTAPVHHVMGNDPRLAPGFVHAVNPEHGEPVTIQPGELMPGWMIDALVSGGSLAVDGPASSRSCSPKAANGERERRSAVAAACPRPDA